MIDNQKPFLSEKERIALAMNNAGDGNGLIMDMSGRTAEDIIKEENTKEFNKQVDLYVNAYTEHSNKLEEYSKKIAENVESIEIMPIGNYVLVKQFDENPFQRIVKQGNIITDLGGQKPIFKNTDNGNIEEEESFIYVGVIQEVGPECKWCKPTDTVMYTKPSAVPVPFYKQGLVLINENRVLVVINEGLTKRFNNGK